MGFCQSCGTGQYVGSGSERHQALWDRPTRLNGTKRAVLLHAGFGQLAPAAALDDVATRVTASGSFLFNVDFVDGKQWGNSTAMTRMDQAWAYAKSAFGAKTDKAVLYGASHGGCHVVKWAKANPTLVAAIALLIPAVDIVDIHDNSRGSALGATPTQMENAFGGLAAWNAAMPAGNPTDSASFLSGIPIKIWYSADDPVCIPSTITTFAAACGATAVSMGNQGHGSSSAFSGQVADFINTYV